jgi:ribosomal-protein-alanine N-acetyltransferase
VLKENNLLIGHCGFVYQDVEGNQEIEFPYLLDKHYWGRGLAIEAVSQTIVLGFEKYKFPHIIALINPNNVASVRVAEKIGMKYERDVIYKDFGQVAMYGLRESELSR